MNAEERYIISCYGLPADMPKIRMTKGGQEIECRGWREVQAMLDDGWQTVPKVATS